MPANVRTDRHQPSTATAGTSDQNADPLGALLAAAVAQATDPHVKAWLARLLDADAGGLDYPQEAQA
jgi:hypothetical protein